MLTEYPAFGQPPQTKDGMGGQSMLQYKSAAHNQINDFLVGESRIRQAGGRL